MNTAYISNQQDRTTVYFSAGFGCVDILLYQRDKWLRESVAGVRGAGLLLNNIAQPIPDSVEKRHARLFKKTFLYGTQKSCLSLTILLTITS